jgi:WD repeat-containing protein 89
MVLPYCLSQLLFNYIMVANTSFSVEKRIQTETPTDLQICNGVVAVPTYADSVSILDAHTFQTLATLANPTSTSTQIKLYEQSLFSSYKQGVVKLWDLRTQSVEMEIASDAPIASFDVQNNMLVSGTDLVVEDVKLIFTDLRTGAQLQVFDEVHSDDCTQIRIHPLHPHVMMSGATDGLINLYDLTKLSEGQDECLYQIIKCDSVSTLGYFGPEWEYIHSTSHMETFSIFKFNQGEVVKAYGDCRDGLDYLIRAEYDSASQVLMLMGGTQDGEMKAFNVGLEGLEEMYTLSGGHSDIVRGFALDRTRRSILSAGEDGQICSWVQC